MSRLVSWINRHPFPLFLLLYAAVGLFAFVAWQILPDTLRGAVHSLTGGAGLGIAEPGAFGRTASRVPPPDVPLWAITTVAMVSGGLLSLPVAWLYTITRSKRGYRQSVVQTLILLPLVVAGVVVLVKFSLALAFSLAGIVAAVRFRNTLEDSKDAVFIFVATGIGLAAGVELTAAATLSFVFNLATLLLFLSDFGRTPARLEGEIAEERMQRALRVANRTSQFVARIDREILEEMAPEQLAALAERALKRKQQAEGEERDEGGEGIVLRVRTNNAIAVRGIVESILTRDAKRWKLKDSIPENTGEVTLEYTLRLRRAVAPEVFLAAVRSEHRSGVLGADLS